VDWYPMIRWLIIIGVGVWVFYRFDKAGLCEAIVAIIKALADRITAATSFEAQARGMSLRARFKEPVRQFPPVVERENVEIVADLESPTQGAAHNINPPRGDTRALQDD
jgi:hypothetical protein